MGRMTNNGDMRRNRGISMAMAAAVFAVLGAGKLRAGAPEPGTVFWHPDEAHCRFNRTETPEPDRGDPATWRFLFVSELVSDDLASAERGYLRLDGLLRELEFTSRRETDMGERRTYRTFGEEPVTIDLDLVAGKGEKSRLGQTILVHYTGTMTVSRGGSQRLVPLHGSCGVEPET